MEDYSKQFRKKNRFIFELRYKPILEILDQKGKIIDAFHKSIESKYPFWLINGSDIIFQDNLELPKNEYLIGLKRMTVITEDITTYEEYIANTYKQLKQFQEYFGLNHIERIGFRIISTYSSSELYDFDDARKRIEERFLKDPLELGLKHTDLFIRIIHKNGAYIVGPIKKGEEWMDQNFRDLSNEKTIANYGIGLDIDSYAANVDYSKYQELAGKVEDVVTLSKAIEDSLIKSLGL